MPVGFVKRPAELFLVAAFGRESASAREDGEGKLSDEKVPGGFRQQLSGQSRGQLKDKETVGELTRGLR